MDRHKLRLLMKAFIESQFNYCPLLWMFHNRTMNRRINTIHERALRIAYKDYESSFEQLLTKDNSFRIDDRNLQRLATEIYKTQNGLAPNFMKEIFTPSTNPYNLRKNASLETSSVKTVNHGTETVSFRANHVWSIVPDYIKNSISLDEFKIKIKNWKPEGCSCRLCIPFIPQLGFI